MGENQLKFYLKCCKIHAPSNEKLHSVINAICHNDRSFDTKVMIALGLFRWFFKNCDFLGLDALPSIQLNKIAAMLAMKLFGFNLIACLRKDLEGDFENMIVESIFEEFIEFPALVKAKGDKIVITFHGNYKDMHKVAIEKLMKKLDETERNVPIPWLGNRRIIVKFK